MGDSEQIPVDFGNSDEDGAVRLGPTEYLKQKNMTFFEGQRVVMSDGEEVAEGLVTLRDGWWVVRIQKWRT
jgi:hypothetical protein